MRTTLAMSLLGVTAVACHLGRGSVATAKDACEPLPPTCARVSGGDVGRLPLEVQVGEGMTVRLEEWTQSDATSAAVVGFAARLPDDVVFTVSAGDEQFDGRGGRWLNPHGVAGPRVHPIREVTFCRAQTACATHQASGAVASR